MAPVGTPCRSGLKRSFSPAQEVEVERPAKRSKTSPPAEATCQAETNTATHASVEGEVEDDADFDLLAEAAWAELEAEECGDVSGRAPTAALTEVEGNEVEEEEDDADIFGESEESQASYAEECASFALPSLALPGLALPTGVPRARPAPSPNSGEKASAVSSPISAGSAPSKPSSAQQRSVGSEVIDLSGTPEPSSESRRAVVVSARARKTKQRRLEIAPGLEDSALEPIPRSTQATASMFSGGKAQKPWERWANAGAQSRPAQEKQQEEVIGLTQEKQEDVVDLTHDDNTTATPALLTPPQTPQSPQPRMSPPPTSGATAPTPAAASPLSAKAARKARLKAEHEARKVAREQSIRERYAVDPDASRASQEEVNAKYGHVGQLRVEAGHAAAETVDWDGHEAERRRKNNVRQANWRGLSGH